jgi:hypothetical protein
MNSAEVCNSCGRDVGCNCHNEDENLAILFSKHNPNEDWGSLSTEQRQWFHDMAIRFGWL